MARWTARDARPARRRSPKRNILRHPLLTGVTGNANRVIASRARVQSSPAYPCMQQKMIQETEISCARMDGSSRSHLRGGAGPGGILHRGLNVRSSLTAEVALVHLYIGRTVRDGGKGGIPWRHF
ncbi:hypothetical protein PUN28_018984 [Cardiocondyla obscurior]|uniref:Ribosomal protein S14 n=1 Tax=Cardiocondyla obscurior TaxID=286306 RepID=A0AAW2EGQ7_9HYME